MSRTLLILVGVLLLILGIALFIGLAVMGSYNKLVTLDESATAAWSNVETSYQRRLDLIPNLVATVKGVAEFEKETFTAVTEARAKAGQVSLSPELLKDPGALARFASAQGELSSALSRLLVTVERYPQLKANESFLSLQDQLEGTENRIDVARKRFNDAVRNYNTTAKRFPAKLVAGMFGFAERPYFEAQQGAEEAPKVEF